MDCLNTDLVAHGRLQLSLERDARQRADSDYLHHRLRDLQLTQVVSRDVLPALRRVQLSVVDFARQRLKNSEVERLLHPLHCKVGSALAQVHLHPLPPVRARARLSFFLPLPFSSVCMHSDLSLTISLSKGVPMRYQYINIVQALEQFLIEASHDEETLGIRIAPSAMDFTCPISLVTMIDPVKASNDVTYDRFAAFEVMDGSVSLHGCQLKACDIAGPPPPPPPLPPCTHTHIYS